MVRNVINIDKITLVINRTKYIFDNLSLLTSTPTRTTANYLAWRLVLFGAKFLNSELHERNQAYIATISGTHKSVPRQTECAEQTMKL